MIFSGSLRFKVTVGDGVFKWMIVAARQSEFLLSRTTSRFRGFWISMSCSRAPALTQCTEGLWTRRTS